ncbi:MULTISPECIES: dephospho-CoA kinase [unclassified Thioalkalivibrio]|uniref:dephospho-CoA kinase n=1 Tax=unclassified Thioalkalivibrio TaxID=2621013 RepID=UPI000376127C|nr:MULTISPECIES: dephospho-CoA kinase [unclassified Thioalkalivibrio]
MRRVGLTGGIGCGKSRVAGLFASLGVPVLDADRITRELQEPGHDLHAAIVQQFGPGVLDARGRLDRGALRTRIFAQPDERKALEALVHPAVHAELERRLRDLPDTNGYALIVVPLLFEAGWEHEFDPVIVVDCEPEEQLERVTHRDGRTPAEVQAIMDCQLSPDERRQRGDRVITNDRTTTDEDLRQQVSGLHDELRAVTGHG